MRITYLSVSDQLGGSEAALLDMVRGIRRLRPSWNVQIVLPGHGPLLARAEAAGASCVVLPMPRALARIGESAVSHEGGTLAKMRLAARLMTVAPELPLYCRRLRRILRASRPDVLHTNGLKAHVLGVWAADSDASVIWHIHEYISRRPATRALLRRYAGRANAIVANSRSVAADVSRAIDPATAVRVVHNAVDLTTFTPRGARVDLDALSGLRPTDEPVLRVGLVSTFGKWKGHDVFLRALAALPGDVRVRGYVIGGAVYDTAGSQRTLADLHAQVRALELSGRVGFTGFVSAPEAMRALDVVVHASTEPEPFGLVIAEAMACARAVITSGAGGAAELVEPERDALVHEPGDPTSLAEAIASLARDQYRRVAMGLRARTAAQARFDPDRFARQLIDIYEGVRHGAVAASGAASVHPVGSPS